MENLAHPLAFIIPPRFRYSHDFILRRVMRSCVPATAYVEQGLEKVSGFQLRERIADSELLCSGDCSFVVHVALVMLFFVVMIVVRRMRNLTEIDHREQRKY